MEKVLSNQLLLTTAFQEKANLASAPTRHLRGALHPLGATAREPGEVGITEKKPGGTLGLVPQSRVPGTPYTLLHEQAGAQVQEAPNTVSQGKCSISIHVSHCREDARWPPAGTDRAALLSGCRRGAHAQSSCLLHVPSLLAKQTTPPPQTLEASRNEVNFGN